MMTATIVNEGRGLLAIRVDGASSIANAGQGQVANPEGVDLLILRTTLVVHSPSTGAGTISIGVGVSGAAATDIINALAMNGVAAQTAYNGHAMQNTAKTEITVPARWTADKYLTFTGSASLVGLEATLYVDYIRTNEPNVASQ